jgi:hypothetical protein
MLAGFFMRFTIRDLLWLMIVVAVALAFYVAKPRRTRWEYKTTRIQTFNKFDLSAEGNDGWELMQVDDKSDSVLTLYFKRPK